MSNDISESVSQRGYGAETPQNRRIYEISDELRRRCQLYEAQFRDGQETINHFEVEQRVSEQYAKENGMWIPMSNVFELGTQVRQEMKTTPMFPMISSIKLITF